MRVPERQAQIDALTRKYLEDPKPETNGHPPVEPSIGRPDEEIIERARAENGGKFERLYRGDLSDYGNDHSAADDGFVHKLWPYTQDEDQIRRIHAGSGLHRPEKSGRRADYLQRSINRARENVSWFYDWEIRKKVKTISVRKSKPQDEVHSRSRSLSSTGMRNEADNALKQSIQALSFSGREKPGPREWVVHNLLWKGHASSWFGEGGVAKSLLALHLALTVAAEGKTSWMGFPVKTVKVLYVDFELDADEQHRRAFELATGMGLSEIPEDFYYLSVAMMPPYEAFEIVAEECRRLEIGLVIVDSVGFALEGDSEKASDVLGFYRTCIQPLKDAGASPLLIDHQAKIVKGEKYSDKQAFGSVYKTNAVRSAFQIRGSHDQGEITATFTHKKNNFGWKAKDFSLKIVFGEDSTTVELLQDALPNPDREPSKKELVAAAVEKLGRATAEDVARDTGIAKKSVQNAFTDLIGEGALCDTGQKRERSRIVIPHSRTTKGTGTGMTQETPASLFAEEGEGATDLEVLKERQKQEEAADIGRV